MPNVLGQSVTYEHTKIFRANGRLRAPSLGIGENARFRPSEQVQVLSRQYIHPLRLPGGILRVGVPEKVDCAAVTLRCHPFRMDNLRLFLRLQHVSFAQ